MGIRHKLLRELKLRVAAYEYRVRLNEGPVSALPVVEAARKVAQNYRETRQERNDAHAAYNRQLRAARKAKGECVRCGKWPARTDRVTCVECGRRDVESSRRQYNSVKKKLKQVKSKIEGEE